MDAHTITGYLTSLGSDPFALGVAILLATFVLEDAATAGAALLAADGIVPVSVAITALFVGITLGDLGLYGLGWLAARNARARRMLQHRAAQDMSKWMHQRVITMVFSVRFVPGARLPSYTASGLFGLPFWRFAIATTLAASLWTSVVFTVIYFFGTYYHDQLGPWRWGIAAGAVLILILMPKMRQVLRKSKSDDQRESTAGETIATGNPAMAAETDEQVQTLAPDQNLNHASTSASVSSGSQPRMVAGIPGMPPINLDQAPLSFYEFWPPRIFYIPIALTWIALSMRHFGWSLPTVANPSFPEGGFVGESKSKILDLVQPEGRHWFARHTTFRRDPSERTVAADLPKAMDTLQSNGFTFPVVAKPDLGCRGVGVRLIKNEADLSYYLANFPAGQTIVFQEFVPHEPEAGIFYIRIPGEADGFIFSITLKYFPRVMGDGRSTLRELIEGDPRAGKIAHVYLPRHADRLDRVLANGEIFRLNFTGSHSRGTIFRNGDEYITPEMTAAFDRVAKTIPEFYFGRFDVRFPDFEKLQKGEDFMIVEINGAAGEATSIWDSKTSLWGAYRKLISQFSLLFEIGARNRARGYRPLSIWRLFQLYQKESRLTRDYPQTE